MVGAEKTKGQIEYRHARAEYSINENARKCARG